MKRTNKILIANEDHHTRSALNQLLQTQNYEVAAAASGNECLHIAKQFQPDLALLDVTLPDKNGLEVTREIKTDSGLANIMIALLSPSYTPEQSLAEGLEAGADDYILQPINDREFLARTRALLRIKNTQDKLRESEAQKQAILDASVDAIIHIDRNMNIVWANTIAAKRYNTTPEELIGNKCYRFVLADNAPCQNCTSIKAMNSGIIEHGIICRSAAPDQALYHLEIYSIPISDDSGRITGAVEIARDISARIEAEEERIRLSSAISQSAETVIMLDTEGSITYINPAVEADLGYSQRDIIGQNIFSSERGIYNPAFYKDIWETISSGRTWTGTITYRKHNGELSDFEQSISPIRDGAGTIINYVSIGRDITNELRLQKQLRQAQKLEAIGTLAGGIAHDFNNILAAIIGYSELTLNYDTDRTTVENNLKQILKSANRAKELTKQILTFSRHAEHGKQAVQVKPLVKESIKLLRSSLPATISIITDFTTDALVLADPAQLHQIIINLCNNATQAMQSSGGTLKVILQCIDLTAADMHCYSDIKPGQFIQLSVSDTGTGIDENIIDRIFDPFFTTKQIGKGTGMGLALVHGIIKNHGGDITITSTTGEGTTVTVVLPRIDTEHQPIEPDLAPLNRGRETILLIDDEQPVLDVTETILQKLGYTVIKEVDSTRALQKVLDKKSLCDLIITDLTMPHITGLQLASRLRDSGSSIPVILLSGHRDMIDQEQARNLGIKKHSCKPVNSSKLAQMIRDVLDNP